MRYTKTVHDISSLFEANKGKLFAYLVRLTGNTDEAQDILQESIMRYMEHYRAEENPGALLFTIARNAVIDNRRRRLRIVPIDEDHRDSRTDQEHSLIVKDRYRKVLSSLNKLGEDERDILSMVLSSDLSYREIAAIHGMSVSNVKVKVHRARLRLKKIFEGEE